MQQSLPLRTPIAAAPAVGWIMEQTWHNLLFAHWPVSLEALRAVVPPGLTIDTFEGQAWIGIVAFRLSRIRLRHCPQVPFVTRFTELNLRTYVSVGGKRGVLFLSMDADNRIAITLAKPWFRLPYSYANLALRVEGEQVQFESQRREHGDPSAEFRASYRPSSSAFSSVPGSLEYWLTERYCYYSVNARQEIYRCEISHPHWRLQQAEAEIEKNSIAAARGISLPATPPLLHYAEGARALIWPIRHIGGAIDNDHILSTL